MKAANDNARESVHQTLKRLVQIRRAALADYACGDCDPGMLAQYHAIDMRINAFRMGSPELRRLTIRSVR